MNTAQNQPNNTSGFTLIELLVVLVIMGVMISLVTFSTGIQNRERETHQTALRLISLMRLASDEAVLNGKLLGWQLSEQQYQFMQREEGNWQAVPDDRLLKLNPLPPWLATELEVEGRLVEPLVEPAQTAEPEQLPQLFILPSGEMTAFKLDLFDKNDPQAVRYRLENNYADLRILRIDPEDQ
ncbi:MAG: type II secretion system minor pseudopilin GspH [Pseudomonadales bacterium]|nr:type II secretion system minor pseudopilin GspH [Pseudomonadales bacterium]